MSSKTAGKLLKLQISVENLLKKWKKTNSKLVRKAQDYVNVVLKFENLNSRIFSNFFLGHTNLVDAAKLPLQEEIQALTEDLRSYFDNFAPVHTYLVQELNNILDLHEKASERRKKTVVFATHTLEFYATQASDLLIRVEEEWHLKQLVLKDLLIKSWFERNTYFVYLGALSLETHLAPEFVDTVLAMWRMEHDSAVLLLNDAK